MAVSAATGPVGSAVGQVARLVGARPVGIAGSSEKCRYAVEELGFDACVNYREGDLLTSLKQACPYGIDVYFDNVGGDVLAAALGVLARNARIVLCGMIGAYSANEPPAGSGRAASSIARTSARASKARPRRSAGSCVGKISARRSCASGLHPPDQVRKSRTNVSRSASASGRGAWRTSASRLQTRAVPP